MDRHIAIYKIARRGAERGVVNASRYNGVTLCNSPNYRIYLEISIIRHAIAIDDESLGLPW